METLICEDRINGIPLADHLSKAKPFVLGVEPFVGEVTLPLILEGDFEILCSDGVTSNLVNSFQDVPSSFFLLARENGTYTTFFCLSQNDLHVEMRGLDVHVKSGSSRQANQIRYVLLCVQGDDLYQTVKLTMRYALKLSGGKGKLVEEKPPLPEWFDTLGWLSTVETHQKIVNAIWGMRQQGIQIGYVLIDQGWQEPVMTDFEAESGRFPFGLKGLVEDLQRAGVPHVGVWHGMMGGVEGIDQKLAQMYDFPPDSKGRYFPGYDLGRTFQFFHDYYQYLRNQGISFVQVGGQREVPTFCRENMDPTLLYQNLQSAMQAASSLQFDCSHLNADCLVNENLFYWTTSHIASTGACKTVRDKLMTSLWLQHLMEPDFNAWSTNEGESAAIFHALSGSINVINDLPGEHDVDVLKKMVLPCGKYLKAEQPLTITPESVFDENCICQATTVKGETHIIAAFNLQSTTEHGKISPKLVDGPFAVYSHQNGLLGVYGGDQKIQVTLEPHQSDIFTFAPIREGIAVIGCYSLYLTAGPIIESTLEEESMHIQSEVAAPLILYSERQIMEIRRNGATVPWEYDAAKKILTIDSQQSIANIRSTYSISFA